MGKVDDLTAMTAQGAVNGTHVTDGPLTTSLTRENAPGLLRNEIDDRIVKIRPLATPIDQISRMTGARRAKSMVVEYYSVDTKGQRATVINETPDRNANRDDGRQVVLLSTDNDGIFAPTDSIMVPELKGYENGKETGNLILYVISRGQNNLGINVVALNSTSTGGSAGL